MSITLEDIYKKLETIEEKQDQFQTIVEEFKRAQVKSDEKLEEVKKENQTLLNKIKILERKERKNNVVIFGMEPADDILQGTVDMLKNHLQINIHERDINNIYSAGQENKQHIKLEFTNYIKKQEVLKNAKKLKGTNIHITPELSKEERETFKLLRKHQKKAWSLNLQAKIKNNKLYINEEEFTQEKLLQLETEEEQQSETNTPQPSNSKKQEKQTTKTTLQQKSQSRNETKYTTRQCRTKS